jgi:RHS repeat-associated protein
MPGTKSQRRRIQNASGTSFLYDGANAAQELSGNSVTANLLSGSVDEVFTRTDSGGAFAQLKDALGSTIALMDSSGTVQTSYTYDPYGGTSVTGTANGNEFQYTGRENEGTGLYYYRNRYYSSQFGRFISEDPAGVGINFYIYSEDDPVNNIDPFGLRPRKPKKPSTDQGPPKLAGRYVSGRWVPNLKLRVVRDCFDPDKGLRNRIYTLMRADGGPLPQGMNYWITEQQTNFSLTPGRPGQSTDPMPNQFDDVIGDTSILPKKYSTDSVQYFLASADRHSLQRAFPVYVEEEDGSDFMLLGIWIGRRGGFDTIDVRINGHKAPGTCNMNYF